MSHDHATVAEEEYLQTIFWLQEAGLPMTGANVARAMQLSAPTVHEMIGRLERDGYITRGADKALAFTDNGREHAEGVVRRHRLIERFLTDVLGIPWDEVHEEAERLEHAMSPVLESRMLRRDRRREDVPARASDQRRRADHRRAARATSSSARKVRVLRFENEAEDLLHYLKDAGIEPGDGGHGRRSATTTTSSSSSTAAAASSRARWPRRSRSTADPSPPPRTALPEQLVLSKDRYGR